ncbi:MAG: invasion associated locus B family protein [Alphaproteobacteria bacterium]|nr:invasion associated locus B family protein [Alphaproteobacteria bacterium]
MSNRSSVLPWTIAGVAAVVAAGALGFMAGRYTADTTAPVAPPAGRQQAAGQDQPPPLPPGTTSEKMGDWTLYCQEIPNAGKKSCFAMFESLNADRKVMLAVVAGYDTNANRTLLVRVPLGVQIDKGVEFALGGKPPEAFSFSTCNDVSCDAVLIVSDDGFKQLTEAGSFELAYTLNGQRMASKVSMAGLPDAFGKIERPTPPPTPPAAATPEGKPAPTPAPTPAPDGTPQPTPKPTTP